MKAKILLFMVLVCSISALGQKNKVLKNAETVSPNRPTVSANTNVLPIKRVIIYSNGMVYVERRGIISGNAEVNLSFKQSQIDDVLKSMVVLDLGKGEIGAVSYNSSVPPSALTSEIPFNIESLTDDNSGGIAGVLAQLQGAKILVTSSKQTAIGSILNIEKRTKSIKKDDEETTLPLNYSLVIASENGEITNFELADVRSVKLLDDETKKDINVFANASASARRRDAKTINITSEGVGQREMIVSYTVSAPIWKTSYRVVLDNDGKPFFQGWAIVDNVSEEDWQNVQLSLVSGSPISFIQPLQNPLYRHRPIVEIPDDLSLDPQIYDATRPNEVYRIGNEDRGVGYGSGGGQGRGSGISNDEAPATIKPNMNTSVSDLLSSENAGIVTAAKGEQFGDLFEYKISRPVSVKRNRSALIPIIQTKMEGERISIYRESVKEDRPMSGVLLNNTSNLTLEGGAMTILDNNAYAGESLMERLKPKEKRLISFAIDLGVLIDVKKTQEREPARIIKAINGVFQAHYFNSDQKIYRLTNQTDRAKTLYIEHPIREKWQLSNETQKPFDVTANYYRFRIELEPFSNKDFVVNERQPLADSYNISDLKRSDLELFIIRRYIDDATKDKLTKFIDLREQLTQFDTKLRTLSEEEKAISDDQKRLRENIEALSKTAEAKTLITRYISKANEQESRIEAITKERQNLRSEREKLAAELAREIKNFELK